MRTILIFNSLIILSFSSISQTGTLTIAFISPNDGIYVAADSRSSYLLDENDHKSIYAYYDSNRKIYNLKQFILATSGVARIGGYEMKDIIEQFNSTGFYDTSLLNTFRTFISYLKLRFPFSKFPKWKENGFIGGGYVNGTPQLIGINDKQELWNISEGAVMNDPRASKYLIKYLSRPTTVTEALDSVYAEFQTKENEILVGGPISIYRIISGNISQCIYNDFTNRNFSSNQIHDAILKETIKIHYLIPFGKEVLLGLCPMPSKEILNLPKK